MGSARTSSFRAMGPVPSSAPLSRSLRWTPLSAYSLALCRRQPPQFLEPVHHRLQSHAALLTLRRIDHQEAFSVGSNVPSFVHPPLRAGARETQGEQRLRTACAKL